MRLTLVKAAANVIKRNNRCLDIGAVYSLELMALFLDKIEELVEETNDPNN